MSSRKLYRIIKSGIISLLDALAWRVKNSDIAFLAGCALIGLIVLLAAVVIGLAVPKDTATWDSWYEAIVTFCSGVLARLGAINWSQVATSPGSMFGTVMLFAAWVVRRLIRVDKKIVLGGHNEAMLTANDGLEKALFEAIRSFGNVVAIPHKDFTSFHFGKRVLVRVKPAKKTPLPLLYVYVDMEIKRSSFSKQDRALIVTSDNMQWSKYRVNVSGERGILIVKQLIASVKL